MKKETICCTVQIILPTKTSKIYKALALSSSFTIAPKLIVLWRTNQDTKNLRMNWQGSNYCFASISVVNMFMALNCSWKYILFRIYECLLKVRYELFCRFNITTNKFGEKNFIRFILLKTIFISNAITYYRNIFIYFCGSCGYLVKFIIVVYHFLVFC